MLNLNGFWNIFDTANSKSLINNFTVKTSNAFTEKRALDSSVANQKLPEIIFTYLAVKVGLGQRNPCIQGAIYRGTKAKVSRKSLSFVSHLLNRHDILIQLLVRNLAGSYLISFDFAWIYEILTSYLGQPSSVQNEKFRVDKKKTQSTA